MSLPFEPLRPILPQPGVESMNVPWCYGCNAESNPKGWELRGIGFVCGKCHHEITQRTVAWPTGTILVRDEKQDEKMVTGSVNRDENLSWDDMKEYLVKLDMKSEGVIVVDDELEAL